MTGAVAPPPTLRSYTFLFWRHFIPIEHRVYNECDNYATANRDPQPEFGGPHGECRAEPPAGSRGRVPGEGSGAEVPLNQNAFYLHNPSSWPTFPDICVYIAKQIRLSDVWGHGLLECVSGYSARHI